MTNDDFSPPPADEDSDDLRYAPSAAEGMSSESDQDVEASLEIVSGETGESPLPTEDLDIDAALAAVATLHDVLAEQEASEQAALERQEAAAEAAAEQQARLRHPELFFPMPPFTGLQRGRIDAIVPALALILTGAWLTFTLTTSSIPPDPLPTAVVLATGAALTLLVRWISTGRWSRGTLFFALIIVFTAAGLAVLVLQPGLRNAWPVLLAAPGLAFVLASLLARPTERRLMLPGLMLLFAGAAGLVYSYGLLPANLLITAASLWPAAAIAITILLLLPLITRRRPS